MAAEKRTAEIPAEAVYRWCRLWKRLLPRRGTGAGSRECTTTNVICRDLRRRRRRSTIPPGTRWLTSSVARTTCSSPRTVPLSRRRSAAALSFRAPQPNSAQPRWVLWQSQKHVVRWSYDALINIKFITFNPVAILRKKRCSLIVRRRVKKGWKKTKVWPPG
jgi:hypothetical protein